MACRPCSSLPGAQPAAQGHALDVEPETHEPPAAALAASPGVAVYEQAGAQPLRSGLHCVQVAVLILYVSNGFQPQGVLVGLALTVAGVNPVNGDALWYDKDGNITNVYSENDKVLVGKSSIAPWQGGFNTMFTWKGLSVSAQFTWVKDRWVMNNDRYFDESNGMFINQNQSKKLLYDRWKEPGDIATVPRHGVVMEFDDRLLEDASFLRLKNLNVSYSLSLSKFFSFISFNLKAYVCCIS